MTLLEAIVLGVVQGFTEFLPISSTAHLRIIPAILGWDDPGAAYSAVIQLGTVAAVFVYFMKDLRILARSFATGVIQRRPLGSEASRLVWCILLGTLPIGCVGFLFKTTIETTLRSLYIISASLIALAVMLFIAEHMATHTRVMKDMTLKDGIIIGLWQVLALIPGSSRAGTTLTGGLALGFARKDAARYSFLLSIPATFLAGVFELKHLLVIDDRPSTLALIVGMTVSFLSGLIAIHGLLNFLRTHSTHIFIIYRITFGLALLGLLSTGMLNS